MHHHRHPYLLSASSGNIGSTFEGDNPAFYSASSGDGAFGEIDYRIYSSFTKRMEPIRPHENDVLMGRGGKNNAHSGNEKLREMARRESENYRKSSKKGKSYISRQLVQQMRELSPPSRFLKRDSETGEWEDVGDDVAREKASQVLRDAVALLPDETTDPLPVELSEPQPTYSVAAASIPVSVDETERAQSAYSQRTTPVLSHHQVDLPVPTPVTSASYRKRRRHHYYGYDGYYSEDPYSPARASPAHRRYLSHQHHQQHQHQHQHHYSYPPPIHTAIHPGQPQGHHYEAIYSSAPEMEPTLPRSHSEFSNPQRTNRPPTVSARQASTASAQSLLGSLQSGMNEFDLFNGELIGSDEEEEQKRARSSPRNQS